MNKIRDINCETQRITLHSHTIDGVKNVINQFDAP